MKVLITGGAGYIGSHTLVEVLKAGHEAFVIDSLVNGCTESVARVSRLTDTQVKLAVGDIRDKLFLERIFSDFAPDAVMHFAGLKAVGESVENPLAYYDVNVNGSKTILEVMQSHECQKIVFSSSATVYGKPQYLPYDENHPVVPVNPYGRTKLIVEQMLGDWCTVNPERSALSLRYFNPVGAHPSGLIGENPVGPPNNLMPFIAQVAVGKRPLLQIFGDDYDTRDGTGERDYLHVVDLAKAHVLALDALLMRTGHDVINVGTGNGVTVKEMVTAFETACGCPIKTSIAARRAGDLPSFFANCERAKMSLGWSAELSLADMCKDTWTWQSQNPDGFTVMGKKGGNQ
jgi:UDP-glucose 4-epimerase